MENILIMEDDSSQLKFLVETSNQINSNIKVFGVRSISDAKQILKEYKISAFFIDVKLSDGNGMEFAKSLRLNDRYMFTPIVFITVVPTREMEAFRYVHCFDYIFKPYSSERIEEVFNKILINYFKYPNKISDENLYLEYDRVRFKIKFEDIILIEKISRKILIHTVREKITYKYMPLKEIIKKLSDNYIQVHQSYIINKLYFYSANFKTKTLYLNNIDVEIPIGKRFRKELEMRLNESN